MGFKSTMITEAIPVIEIPKWFKDKYRVYNYGIRFGEDTSPDVFPISTKGEYKFYNDFKDDEKFTDIQRILKENGSIESINTVLLHECGGVTLVKITKETITAVEPTSFRSVKKVEHDCSYDCTHKMSSLGHREEYVEEELIRLLEIKRKMNAQKSLKFGILNPQYWKMKRHIDEEITKYLVGE